MRGNHKYQIMLDYDVRERVFKRRLKDIVIANCIMGFIQVFLVKINQTNKGFHVILNIESRCEFSDNDLVCLQAIYQSDYKREAFNFLRVKNGLKDWKERLTNITSTQLSV